MKALLINGSPRAKGCTYGALKIVEEQLQQAGIETETIHVGHKPIHGCIACMKCKTTGRCVFNDIVNEVAEKLRTADGIVVGTPVYFSGMAGTLKAFLDRLFFSVLGLGMLIMGGNILVVITGGFLFGWAYAGGSVQTIMLVRHVFGSSDYARIYSTISIALAIGGAIMSGAWGLIADRTSYALILSLGIAFLLACLAIGLYAIAYRKRHIANKAWPNPAEQ